MDVDDPTDADIDALLETAHVSIREAIECRDTLVSEVDRVIHGDFSLADIREFLDDFAEDVAELGRLTEFLYVALLLVCYRHRGDEALKKTALQLMSEEELEDFVDAGGAEASGEA